VRVFPVVLLLAGCAAPGIVGPGGHGPTWIDADGLWMARTSGCGLCEGSGAFPEAEALLLYEDGKVLWFSFGFSSDGTGASQEPGLDAWTDEFDAAWARLSSGYFDGHIHVFDARATTVTPSDWAVMQDRLTAWQDAARDPGPPVYDCEDCGAVSVQMFDPDRVAQLHGNFDDGDPWGLTLRQLTALRDWAKAS